ELRLEARKRRARSRVRRGARLRARAGTEIQRVLDTICCAAPHANAADPQAAQTQAGRRPLSPAETNTLPRFQYEPAAAARRFWRPLNAMGTKVTGALVSG